MERRKAEEGEMVGRKGERVMGVLGFEAKPSLFLGKLC